MYMYNNTNEFLFVNSGPIKGNKMAKRKKSERIAIKRACRYSNTKDDPINIEETDDFVEPIQKKTENTSKVIPKKSKESGKKNLTVEETDDFVEPIQKKTENTSKVIPKKSKESGKKNLTVEGIA
ncbi:uncharacterized protein LOC143586175 [Bidens hawaiensis]|uniref:uncharacterized protein LOC143586175 n=1 Tax=Bidens hawaiensis TaxID=980011 RepID=UPI00404AB055